MTMHTKYTSFRQEHFNNFCYFPQISMAVKVGVKLPVVAAK